jgi:hypothetical protein
LIRRLFFFAAAGMEPHEADDLEWIGQRAIPFTGVQRDACQLPGRGLAIKSGTGACSCRKGAGLFRRRSRGMQSSKLKPPIAWKEVIAWTVTIVPVELKTLPGAVII